eukprot:355368-Chlamydomonas_euryale.AAC.9
MVHVDGSPAPEEWLLIASEAEALAVAVAALVGVVDIWVGVADLQHPLGQRDLASVADIAARCMEAHYRLDLEPCACNLLEQSRICRKVELPRPRPLYNAPPDVDHDALNARLLERMQRDLEAALLLEHGHLLAVALEHPHRVERQHDVYWAALRDSEAAAAAARLRLRLKRTGLAAARRLC